ncbi:MULTISPECIES: GNAT family N-acetyltransferase [unclassified Vibrio]|uniref:GNAT family N-acetyltransferase n=1 Tax=unclassified Vibrio TaxID=2614977 RepID=UPI0013613DEC|nr:MULTISPECIES: GNAT family N-acetyltransferase [unclassified Vibrio]NAW59151.1 GNAT family N-acetyltransferase [Vibrio sp. V36_P2S2PM302]NAX26063.1 GNAT family N-acetyltransferase [Vibrio sp. V38_P2S17PM301]NAX30949.1 GNAT family N-acetyltransferase [Vibrio sp. V37_P2S8PM304]
MITWHCLTFSQLTTEQLYQLLQLRVDVFVVEQTCPYPELDGKDRQPGVHHLLGYVDDQLVACARLLPAGISYPSISIGRVAIAANARGHGLGHQLLQQALTHCAQLWPGEAIEIGAQEHLQSFYQQYGFARTSETYLEDGIPHIDMKRAG